MSIPVVCSGCETAMKVPEAAAGKLVKCPNCETRTKVPQPKVESEMDEEPRPRPKPKAAQPIDDEEDRPVRKKARVRDEDDDEEERPRKKKTPSKSGNNKVLFLVLAAVGGLILVGGGVAAVVYFMKGTDLSKPVIKSVNTPAISIITPKSEFSIQLDSSTPTNKAFVRGVYLSPDGNRAVIAMGNGPSQIWELNPSPTLKTKVPVGTALAFTNDGTRVVAQPPSGWPVLVDASTGVKTTDTVTGTWRSGYEMYLAGPWGDFAWKTRHDNWKSEPFRITKIDPASHNEVSHSIAHSDNFVYMALPVNGGKELVFGDKKLGQVKVFDFDKKTVAKQFILPGNPTNKSQVEWECFDASSDGKLIGIARRIYGPSDPNTMEFFDESGKVVASFKSTRNVAFTFRSDRFLKGGHQWLTSILPPGEPFNENSRAIYDADKNAFVGVLRGPKGELAHIDSSADGTIIFLYASGQAVVFDVGSLK